MTPIESHLHTGLRGTFYMLKKISSVLFLLCLGFLLCLLFQLGIKTKSFTDQEIGEFIILFSVVLFGSGLLWMLFRSLHNSWVRRHFKQAKIDFLEQLQREGIISIDVLNYAKSKLG